MVQFSGFATGSITVGGMKNLPLSLTIATLAGAFTLLRPADWSSRTRRIFVFGPGAVAAGGAAAAVISGRAKLRAEGSAGDSTSGGGSAPDNVSTPDNAGLTGNNAGTPRLGPAVAPAMLAVGVGAAVTGVQVLSLRADAAIERWIVRKGVTKPRLWMAAAVALWSLGMDFLDGRASRRKADSR